MEAAASSAHALGRSSSRARAKSGAGQESGKPAKSPSALPKNSRLAQEAQNKPPKGKQSKSKAKARADTNPKSNYRVNKPKGSGRAMSIAERLGPLLGHLRRLPSDAEVEARAPWRPTHILRLATTFR